jgi:uncharacterized protein
MKNAINIGTVDGKPLSIDINELINSRMVVQGSSGSGKSGVIRVLCERISQHIPFMLFDPEGEYATLREVVDLILVGPRGDIPTDLRSVELLVRKLVEKQVSAVFDLSDLKIGAKREYMARAATTIVDLPQELWLPGAIIIDEAQIFCPERGTGQKDVVSTLPVTDLISRGRKRGKAIIPVTQRFSKMHNDALAELKNVFIGSCWLDADQKKAGEYLGLVGNDRRALREMPTRTFYCFGPALSIKGVSKVYIDNAESTFPKAGQITTIRLPKASDAIGHILEQLDDLPAEAEQERRDIASLRAENADLKRQLAERPTIPEPVIEYVDKEVPVMPPETIKAAIEMADTLSQKIVTLTSDLATNVAEFEQVRDDLHSAVAVVTGQQVQPVSAPPPPMPKTITTHSGQTYTPPMPPAPPKPPPAPRTLPSDGTLTSLQSTLLGGIALLDRLGQPQTTLAQVGAVLGKGHNAGPVRGAFKQLHEMGYIVLSGSDVSITEAGRSVAEVPDLRSRADIHALWYQRVKGNELAFLQVLIEAWPHPMSLDQMGERIGKNMNAGPIRGAINALVEKGLASFPDDSSMVASSLLFPEGLA